jgi:ribose/xylose/arabinose/galactoside ABC-type transport system permease subunit
MCIGSAAGFGAMAVLGKLAYDEGVTVGTLLAVRFAFAAVLFWALVFASGEAASALRGLVRRDVAIALGLGAFGYAAQAGCFFAALERIDASLLSLLLYTFPSMVAVAAIVFGLLLKDGMAVWQAIAITLLAGCGMGAVNGALSIILRVPTIIITLGMLSVYRGLADQLANGYPVGPFKQTSAFWNVGDEKLFGHVPYDALVLIGFALVSAYVLRRTTTGLHVYAMGSDRRAAELAGLPVNRIRIGVLVFSGFASAITALIAVAQSEVADPNVGTGYELEAIAAVIIGGTKLTGGSGTVLGSVLGILLIGMIQNGLVIVGVSIYLLIVVSGLVVIAAVAIDRFFTRRREAAMSG